MKERENVFDVNIRDQHINSNRNSRSAERAIIQAKHMKRIQTEK